MTIPVKCLAACVNACIATETDTLNLLQLSSVSRDFEAGFVKSVACAASLPSAVDNKGRLIFQSDCSGYRISDGTVWTNDFTSTCSVTSASLNSWGYNNFGMLADNTTINRSSPVSAVGGFTDWRQVSASSSNGAHSVGVRTNGTAWAWGYGNRGRLGTNCNVNCSSPASVVGGFTNWCQVSAGTNHSLGLRTNGTLWAWGYAEFFGSPLGDNTVICRSSPVSVVGGFSDWCQVSAGCHSLGVRSNGTIWAWGRNAEGHLGDNTTIGRSSPVSVVGGFTDWCGASAGRQHSLGIRTNGTIWAWGYGGQGRLGNNNTLNQSSPVSVVGGFTNWCQISAGTNHSLALRTNGTAWAWGSGTQGQLGNSSNNNCSSPVSVVGGFTNWCQVSAGVINSAGVRTNGTVWTWGAGNYGRLGNNTTIGGNSPVSVVGGFTDWYQVCAASFNLALRAGTRGF